MYFMLFINCKKFYKIIYYFIITISLSGCKLNNIITSQERAHIAKKGDTLYAIAKQYKVPLEDLIRKNNIKVPHTLRVKQKLIIPNKYTSSIKRAYTHQKNKCNYIAPNVVKIRKYHENWVWPAKGKLIKYFNTAGPNKLNGISIAGNKGDPVIATNNGKVVYSGNNLRGYGNLIIIKHDEDFISAYAHNEKILIKEQQVVAKGQQIATLGDSEANTASLHFEIRYKGKPIDPLKILNKK